MCDKRAKDGHSATQILVSQDAGHFLCNHVYYKGCKWAEQQASRVSVEGGIAPSCVFVHVPVEGLPYSVSALASILQDVVVSLCDQKLQGCSACMNVGARGRTCLVHCDMCAEVVLYCSTCGRQRIGKRASTVLHAATTASAPKCHVKKHSSTKVQRAVHRRASANFTCPSTNVTIHVTHAAAAVL